MSEYITEWVSHNIEDPFVREEIVRCRDCKWFDGDMSCDKLAVCAGPDGFCAWGERKVDGE